MAGMLKDARVFAAAVPKGGAVAGYMAYEMAAGLEGGIDFPPSPDSLPLMVMARFDRSERLGAVPFSDGLCPKVAAIPPDPPRALYEDSVARVINHILKGDIFQANISRRQFAAFKGMAEDVALPLFRRLLAGGAAPYAAFLPLEEGAVLSNSPELFLKVEGRQVTAEPIKGTRPRGDTPVADERLASELAADEKERAENIMITDLLRNDLAKVCEDHSIEEPVICAVRTLPHVHHLYSRVSGQLREGLGPMDALLAAFPCGSITGAPKHEAMRIIAQEEGEGRGPYCGTIFYIPDEGPAIFSVPIRTGVLSRQGDGCRLDVRSGGGVTILSDPSREYEETVDKAYSFRAMTT